MLCCCVCTAKLILGPHIPLNAFIKGPIQDLYGLNPSQMYVRVTPFTFTNVCAALTIHKCMCTSVQNMTQHTAMQMCDGACFSWACMLVHGLACKYVMGLFLMGLQNMTQHMAVQMCDGACFQGTACLFMICWNALSAALAYFQADAYLYPQFILHSECAHL